MYTAEVLDEVVGLSTSLVELVTEVDIRYAAEELVDVVSDEIDETVELVLEPVFDDVV